MKALIISPYFLLKMVLTMGATLNDFLLNPDTPKAYSDSHIGSELNLLFSEN